MKKKFKKSEFHEQHKFMESYGNEFYIEDVLSDDSLDLSMKSMFITHECELSIIEVKKFVIGYAKLMPQDKMLSETIYNCEMYMDDRVTLQQLNEVPINMLREVVSRGLDFEAMPKLPLMLYNLNNDDKMMSTYVHLICNGCSYHLQYDSDKVLQYFKDFVSKN